VKTRTSQIASMIFGASFLLDLAQFDRAASAAKPTRAAEFNGVAASGVATSGSSKFGAEPIGKPAAPPRIDTPDFSRGRNHPGHSHLGGPHWWIWGGVYFHPGWANHSWGSSMSGLAMVDLDVTPEEAEVILDGESIGQTDDFDGFPDFLYLEPGLYSLEFHAPGFESRNIDLHVRSGRYYRIDDELRPGNSVNPDDSKSGAPPPHATRRFFGRNSAPGDEVRVPSSVNVAIKASPADTELWLDGELLGEASLLEGMVELSPGQHELVAMRPGYRSRVISLVIARDRNAGIDVSLESVDFDPGAPAARGNTKVTSSAFPEGFHFFAPGIVVGGQPTPADLLGFRDEGFRTIVSLRTDQETGALEERNEAEAAGLFYVQIPVTPDTLNEERVQSFREAVTDRSLRPMVVHCASGNRVGMMFAILAGLDEGKSIDEAEQAGIEAGLSSDAATKAFRHYVTTRSR